MNDTLILAFLIFLIVGVATAYRDSGFLGALLWGPALALLLLTAALYILIVSGGVAAVTAAVNTIGKVLV